MCLFWKAEKIALKNSVKNCGGVLSRTFSLSKAQVHKTQRSYLSSKRMTGWIQFYAEEDAKMMMMFQKRGKNVPKIDLTDKSWFSCVFSDQSFLYEKPLVFSSIFFWIASRIKLSPPQDEISFVKDLDMSIKSVKAQKRERDIFFIIFSFFKSSLFSSSALASFVNCKKLVKSKTSQFLNETFAWVFQVL